MPALAARSGPFDGIRRRAAKAPRVSPQKGAFARLLQLTQAGSIFSGVMNASVWKVRRALALSAARQNIPVATGATSHCPFRPLDSFLAPRGRPLPGSSSKLQPRYKNMCHATYSKLQPKCKNMCHATYYISATLHHILDNTNNCEDYA